MDEFTTSYCNCFRYKYRKWKIERILIFFILMSGLPYQIQLQIENGFTRFRCTGTMDKAAFLDLHVKIRKHFEGSAGSNYCLVDLANMTSVLSELDRYELAISTTENLRGIKFATLVSDKRHLGNLYETASNNRGVEVLISSNEADAIKWLLGEPK